MKPAACEEPLPFSALVDYWSDPRAGLAPGFLEEHLFSCEHCSARLAAIVTMGRGIARLGRGAVRMMLTPSLLERLRVDGVKMRSYAIDAGGAVACTVAPDDELCVTTLRADLQGVERLDLEVFDERGVVLSCATDVPFDRARGEVLIGDSSAFLRALPALDIRLRLTAIGPSQGRVVGEYRMSHSPWAG
jgi:hypothetical protein